MNVFTLASSVFVVLCLIHVPSNYVWVACGIGAVCYALIAVARRKP